METSNIQAGFNDALGDSTLDVPNLLLPTLERLEVSTVGELASLEESVAAKTYGVGVRKLELLKELIRQARELVGYQHPRRQSSLRQASENTRLLFIPSLLRATFDRDEVDTVGRMVSLDHSEVFDRGGWGERKLQLLTALQKLYVRLYDAAILSADASVSTVVEAVLLPDSRIGTLSIATFSNADLSELNLSGAAKSDAEGLQGLLASRFRGGDVGEQSGGTYFGNTDLAALDWRDVPLQVNARAVGFLDRFRLTTLGQIDQMSTTGMVERPGDGEFVAVLDQDNFGEGSFDKLKAELRKLEKNGLEEYRRGLICSLDSLPQGMAWHDVPLRVAARTITFLDKYGLTSIDDVHRLALRAQVACPDTGKQLSALEQKNFTDRSLINLRKELIRLADSGIDAYRYGDSGKPETVAELVDRVSETVNEREFNVLRIRCSGVTLEEAAVQISLTREGVRQIESAALKKCRAFVECATGLLAPLDKRLKDDAFVQREEACGLVNANDVWQFVLASMIASTRYYLLQNGRVSKFSQKQIEGLDLLVREATRTNTFRITVGHISISQIVDAAADQKKWFVREWVDVLNGNDLTLSKESLVKLIGKDWLRTYVRTQLVNAGINGLYFDQIDTASVVSSDTELRQWLGDEVDVLPDGRFRRPGKVYRKSVEVIEIIRQSPEPITATQIMVQSNEKWQQPVLVGQYLTALFEVAQTGRGEYWHVERLGLTVRDVARIADWGAELLAGEKTQVDGELLFDLYTHSALELPVNNAHQLVSIVAKHPDVRRVSNNLKLVHRATFEESELFLAATDPDLAAQWHPAKNGKATPENVRPTSAKLYWWRCENGHEFRVSAVYRTRSVNTCPGCQGKWTVNKIRHFVASLIAHLDSLTPAELYVIFQQSGLWQHGGKSRGFVKALATGRFPKNELDKFADGASSLVDEFLDDEEFNLEQVDDIDEETIGPSDGDDDAAEGRKGDIEERPLPEVRTKKALAALDNVVLASTDAEAVDFLVASAKAKIWSHAYQDEAAAVEEAKDFTGSEYAEQVRTEFLNEYEAACVAADPS
ncbi:MAG: zinc-ribbon domain-containing protein, partial [Planctomycetales bacterium]